MKYAWRNFIHICKETMTQEWNKSFFSIFQNSFMKFQPLFSQIETYGIWNVNQTKSNEKTLHSISVANSIHLKDRLLHRRIFQNYQSWQHWNLNIALFTWSSDLQKVTSWSLSPILLSASRCVKTVFSSRSLIKRTASFRIRSELLRELSAQL